IRGQVLDQLKEVCTDVGSADDPAFDLSCFHEHLFDILFQKLEVHKYLPNLHNFYLKYRGDKMLVKFLEAVEVKARIINDPSLPVDGTDISRMMTSFSNIE